LEAEHHWEFDWIERFLLKRETVQNRIGILQLVGGTPARKVSVKQLLTERTILFGQTSPPDDEVTKIDMRKR
jgi:hypothetical protein